MKSKAAAGRLSDRESDDRARSFHFALDLLIIGDRDGTILDVNPSWQEILGLSKSDLVGRLFLDFIHPDDAEETVAQSQTVLAGGKTVDFLCRYRHADGHWVPTQWRVSADVESGRVFGVGRDRSAWDAATRSRRLAEARLDFASELHDGALQSLAVMSIKLELLRRADPPGGAGSLQILDDLTDLVMAEQKELRLFVDEVTGESTLVTGPGPLGERIGTLLDRVGRVWGVKVESSIDIAGVLDAATERAVLRVLQEGAVNAIRHGRAAKLWIDVHMDADCVILEISDDGVGFPFKGDFDHETLIERRIGPVSLKSRLRRLGGRISIKSSEKGSQILIRLPIEPSIDASAPEAAS